MQKEAAKRNKPCHAVSTVGVAQEARQSRAAATSKWLGVLVLEWSQRSNTEPLFLAHSLEYRTARYEATNND